MNNQQANYIEWMRKQRYHRNIGIVDCLYSLIEKGFIESTLKIKKLKSKNLSDKIKKFMERNVFGEHEKTAESLLEKLLDEFLKIKDEIDVIFHGLYSHNDDSYLIVDLKRFADNNSESFDNYYKDNDEMEELSKRLINWLNDFGRLITLSLKLANDSLFVEFLLSFADFLLFNEEANKLFEVIGAFIVKFSTIDALISLYFQNCETFECNKVKDPGYPLARLEQMFPENENMSQREKETKSMFREINNLRNDIRHRFLEWQEIEKTKTGIEEIKLGINRCDNFLNLLLNTEKKYEYAFVDPNSEIGKAVMNRSKGLKH